MMSKPCRLKISLTRDFFDNIINFSGYDYCEDYTYKKRSRANHKDPNRQDPKLSDDVIYFIQSMRW